MERDTQDIEITQSTHEKEKPKSKFENLLLSTGKRTEQTRAFLQKQKEEEKEVSIPELDDLRKEITELEESTTDDQELYLTRSKTVLSRTEAFRKKLYQDLQELEILKFRNGSDITSVIDPQLEALKNLKGPQKLSAPFRRANLENRRTMTSNEIIKLEQQIAQKQNIVHSLADSEVSITNRREQTILSYAAKEISLIAHNFESITHEILTGEILQDTRNTYIAEIVSPEVKRIAKSKNLPEEKTTHFLEIISQFSEHRDDPGFDLQPLRNELNQLLTYEGGFWDIEYVCHPILSGQERSIIQNISVHLAAKEVIALKKAFSSLLPRYEAKSKLDSQISELVDPNKTYLSREDTFSARMRSESHGRGAWEAPNMLVWNALLKTPSLMEMMGKTLQEEDVNIYNKALDISLSDFNGQYIDLLYYYPTPDSIRTLVVIAAADYATYRTVHANWCFDSFSKRPDWPSILDTAQNQYPAIKAVRPLLESWNLREYFNHPEIQAASQELALEIYREKSVDQRLINLAAVSLPNDTLIEIVAERKTIEPEMASNLKKAFSLIEKLDKESWKQAQEGDYSKTHIYSYELKKQLRSHLFSILEAGEGGISQTEAETFYRLNKLSEYILNNSEDQDILGFVTSEAIIKKLLDPSISREDISLLLEAHSSLPFLRSNFEITQEFCHQFTGIETVEYFENIHNNYHAHQNRLVRILKLVSGEKLSKERALELPSKAPFVLESDFFQAAERAPEIYLNLEADVQFFKTMVETYATSEKMFYEVTNALAEGHVSRQIATIFPETADSLMQDKFRETRIFIFQNSERLLKEKADLKFVNDIAGEFGSKADYLIRGYERCLNSGVVSPADKLTVLEFIRQFRVISPNIIGGYKEAKTSGQEQIFIAQLRELADKVSGSSPLTPEDRTNPYYRDIVRHVYANNSGQWSSYESNLNCPDRSQDLENLIIKPRYEIDLLSQGVVRVKEGQLLNETIRDEVQLPILAISDKSEKLDNNKEKLIAQLKAEIKTSLDQIIENGGLSGIDMDKISTTEEQLFLILSDSIYGSKTMSTAAVKDLFLTYEFTTFDSVKSYIDGTSDRVSRASNQTYALLCELNSFYSDRVKEVNHRVIELAWENEEIAAFMPQYFRSLTQSTSAKQKTDKINRLQITKLGESDSFIREMGRVLKSHNRDSTISNYLKNKYGRSFTYTEINKIKNGKLSEFLVETDYIKSINGKDYSPEEVKRIIRKYEGLSDKLTKESPPPPATLAFYNLLRSQKERTISALKIITGETIDPQSIHLGEINLQEALAAEISISEGKYDQNQFETYTVQKFLDLFENEITNIGIELNKFESIAGKKREVLYAYISKTTETANARMVGGVCVCGDNPDRYKDNLWDMPNYFELDFVEPETQQCQGLCLLHQFEEDGQKILTVSMNPSSTYLYSVDEEALFNGIVARLEEIAETNEFDSIMLSRNRTIRTNRTGGAFEIAMNKRIAQVNKTFKFKETKQFSHHPDYRLSEMDIIWERKK